MMDILSNGNAINEQKHSKFGLVILWIAYLAPLLIAQEGILKTLGTSVVFVCALILYNRNEFYFLLPLFIFFNNFLVLPGGIVIFRVYSMLLCIKIILNKDFKFKRYLPVFSIYFAYSLFVIFNRDYKMAFSVIFDIFVIMIFILNVLDDENNFNGFFKYFAIAALVSAAMGLFRTHVTSGIDDLEQYNIARYTASFDDPNYAGFFFNIAIFAMFTIHSFKVKFIKYAIVVALYVALFSTISTTAILCNVIGVIVFFIFNKKKRPYITMWIILITMIISLAYASLNISSYAGVKKFSTVMEQLNEGKYSDATTKRYDIWNRHLEYYIGQPASNILLGGNYLTDYGRDDKFAGVSHQVYIDMLINFGFIGTLFILIFFFRKTYKHLISIRKNFNTRALLLIMISYIWFFYSLGLSMFPAWMFMMFFLI